MCTPVSPSAAPCYIRAACLKALYLGRQVPTKTRTLKRECLPTNVCAHTLLLSAQVDNFALVLSVRSS